MQQTSTTHRPAANTCWLFLRHPALLFSRCRARLLLLRVNLRVAAARRDLRLRLVVVLVDASHACVRRRVCGIGRHRSEGARDLVRLHRRIATLKRAAVVRVLAVEQLDGALAVPGVVARTSRSILPPPT